MFNDALAEQSILYTALTRAQECAFIVTSDDIKSIYRSRERAPAAKWNQIKWRLVNNQTDLPDLAVDEKIFELDPSIFEEL